MCRRDHVANHLDRRNYFRDGRMITGWDDVETYGRLKVTRLYNCRSNQFVRKLVGIDRVLAKWFMVIGTQRRVKLCVINFLLEQAWSMRRSRISWSTEYLYFRTSLGDQALENNERNWKFHISNSLNIIACQTTKWNLISSNIRAVVPSFSRWARAWSLHVIIIESRRSVIRDTLDGSGFLLVLNRIALSDGDGNYSLLNSRNYILIFQVPLAVYRVHFFMARRSHWFVCETEKNAELAIPREPCCPREFEARQFE